MVEVIERSCNWAHNLASGTICVISFFSVFRQSFGDKTSFKGGGIVTPNFSYNKLKKVFYLKINKVLEK